MRSSAGKWTLQIAATAVILWAVFPRGASANVALPSTLAFRLPLWMSVLTFGLLFVAISLIEALFLRWLVRLDWRKALLLSFAANAVSTLIGGLMTNQFSLIVLVVLLLFVPGELRKRWGVRGLPAYAAALLPFACFFFLGVLFSETELALTPWAIYAPLLPALFLSILLEAVIIRRSSDQRRVLLPLVYGNVTTYALLIVVFIAAGIRPEDNPWLDSYSLEKMAAWHAREGNIERALELVQLRQDRFLGERIGPWFRRVRRKPREAGYDSRCEATVARILMEKQEYAAARRLLADTLKLNLFKYEGEYTVIDCRDELERVLSELPYRTVNVGDIPSTTAAINVSRR
jgi:hypothetical protein